MLQWKDVAKKLLKKPHENPWTPAEAPKEVDVDAKVEQWVKLIAKWIHANVPAGRVGTLWNGVIRDEIFYINAAVAIAKGRGSLDTKEQLQLMTPPQEPCVGCWATAADHFLKWHRQQPGAVEKIDDKAAQDYLVNVFSCFTGKHAEAMTSSRAASTALKEKVETLDGSLAAKADASELEKLRGDLKKLRTEHSALKGVVDAIKDHLAKPVAPAANNSLKSAPLTVTVAEVKKTLSVKPKT